MADNITIKDGNLATQVLGSTDLAGVHLPKHQIVGPDGSPVQTSGDSLNVSISDSNAPAFGLYVHRHIGSFTLNANQSLDSRVMAITTDGTVPAVGNLTCFKEAGRYYQGTVLISAPAGGNVYTITLDTPLDYAYTTAAICSLTEADLATSDGSITPVVYHIQPPAGIKWHCQLITLYMEDSTTMDDGTFGGMPALTNGIFLRMVDGTWGNMGNVKKNGEFFLRGLETSYVDKPPAGTGYSFQAKRVISGPTGNGVVIELDGDTSDELQVVVQDDLTPLDAFHIMIHGHVTTET